MKNHYGKKSMLALAATMLVPALSMQAGWGTAETPDVIYRGDGGMSSLKTARTADGMTFLTWAEYSAEQDGGYDLRMQLLDSDGNALWGEGGIIVDTKPTTSWIAGYSLVVTPEGDAVVSWADARNDEEGEYLSLDPVLYKVSKQKEMLWGEDGVEIDTEYKFPPVLYAVGGDIYAKLYSVSDEESSVLVRLDENGGFATEPMTFAGSIIASSEGDFIAVGTGKEGTEAMRYNRDLQPVWNSPALVSTYLYEGYDTDPYILASDGNGGVVISFIRPMGMFGHMPIVQYITADGEAVFGEAADVIVTEAYDHMYPVLAVDTDDQEIFCSWQISSEAAMLGGQEFDFFGERLWGDDAKVLVDKDDPSGFTFGPMAAGSLSDNTWLLCYADELGWNQNQMYLAAFNHDGDKVWNRQIGDVCAVIDHSCYLENNDYYIIWINEVTDDDWNTERMIQTVKVSDLTSGVSEMTSDYAQKDIDAYYSLDGARHNSPVKGVNIVRYTDGSSRKMMVK